MRIPGHLGHSRPRFLPPARGFDHSLTVYYGQADHYDHSIIGVERSRALADGMPPEVRPVDLHRDSQAKGHEHGAKRTPRFPKTVTKQLLKSLKEAFAYSL